MNERPACDAHLSRTRISASGFGVDYIPCGQVVGLRSFTDRQGDTRRHCSQDGHRFQVERRFGVADPVEPDWELPEGQDSITLAKGYAEWTEAEKAAAWSR